MNQPTLLIVHTLVLLGAHLADGGRVPDAWTLFGITLRLAQSINLHRNPELLDRVSRTHENAVRQSLW